MFQTPRVGKPGGGVGFFVKKVFDCHIVNAPTFSTFENIVISVQYSNHCINLASIYKPPEKSMPLFRNEFASFSGFLSTLPSPTVISGDFNIQWDVEDSSKRDFQLVLESCNLQQYVNFPTQTHGHTLDFIVAPSNFNGISSVRNAGCFSDHFCIVCNLDPIPSPVFSDKKVSFRQYHKIDMDLLLDDLRNSDLIKDPAINSSDLYDQYVTTLSSLLDKFAPSKTKVLKKPAPP